ncbi:MAG: hypothetical protein ACRDJM_10840 [Actinomycetota bacterium]
MRTEDLSTIEPAEAVPDSSPPALGPARREVLIAAFVAVLISVVMNFGIVRHLTTKIPGTYDGLLAAWEMTWVGHASTHNPAQLWQSNAHYPNANGLAFHDALFGYGIPFGWMGTSPTAALIRFNLLFLFAYAMAFFGAWFLARELGIGALPAAIAGAAFAFAPWRLSQPDHLHVLSSGGIPLSIALMLRGYRRRSIRTVIGGWLVATWQLSLGFTTGLMLAYLLGGLAVLAAVWWAVTRVRIDRRMVLTTVAGVAVFAGWAAYQAAPYLWVARTHPEAVHSIGAVTKLSPTPAGYLTVPPGNFVWGRRAAPAARREGLLWPSEQELFPGALALTFGAMGLFAGILRPWRRVVLILAIGLTVLLSMGFRSPVLSGVYKFWYDHAPGWKGIRTPGRLTTITTLALGILAAAGVHWLVTQVKRRTLAAAVSIVIVGGVLLEGAGTLRLYTPPARTAAQPGLPGPQMHLPSDPDHDMHYMFWSVGDFPKIVNGHAIFIPRAQSELRRDIVEFPDARSVQLLRNLGVRTVVWHRAFAPGTPWGISDAKPIEGLGITRRNAGDIVIFIL